MKNVRKWLTLLPMAGLATFALVVFIRLQIASANVQRDLESLASVTPLDIGETRTLEILPLYDGAASQPNLQSGLGVSYLIKTDTATILLDVGNNPDSVSPSPLEQNMTNLGVNFDQVDMIVFSHTHFDHTGGQYWRSQGTFSVSGDTQIPLGDRPVYVPEALTYPGKDLIVAKSPIKIAEGIAITGAIPFVYPFPAGLAIPQGVEESLVINVKDVGIVLVTGCGHMGIDSLLRHAKADFKEPIAGLVGGLHEGNADAHTLQPQFRLLQGLPLKVIAVSPHDSRTAALTAFEQAFPDIYKSLQVGTSIVLP